MLKLFEKKELNQLNLVRSNTIHYERINFLNYLKNNGDIRKVLCLYEDIRINPDVIYFQDRSRTEVPCIDKEILIIANYDHEPEKKITYTLVQTDFSIPVKFKILMIEENQRGIFEYIRHNKLVEIKSEDEFENKKPQIDFGYGSVIVEVLESLKTSIERNKEYTKDELYELILENVNLSESFKESADSIKNEKTMHLRVKNRAMYYLDIIFNGYSKDSITIHEAFSIGKKYQENYYYNV